MASQDLPKFEVSPELVGKLETLDDVIFPAIEGDPDALNASEQVWKATVAEVGASAIAETRCEYLRYARSTWQSLKNQTVGNPLRMLAVLKILGLLLGEDT